MAKDSIETKVYMPPIKKFKCKHYDFEDKNISFVAVHVLNVYPETFHPTETSFQKPPHKKQDYAPYEPSFTQCLLKGAGCSSNATNHISNAKIGITNQVKH